MVFGLKLGTYGSGYYRNALFRVSSQCCCSCKFRREIKLYQVNVLLIYTVFLYKEKGTVLATIPFII